MVSLRKNQRARRYSLRIANSTGAISLTVPRGGTIRDAEQFAIEHEGWMRKHLQRKLPTVVPEFGGRILVDGEYARIEHGTGRSVRMEDGVLYVPGSPEQLAGKLRGFFKALARERLVPASERYAAAVGRSFKSVSLRDTRSRWGSCSSSGNLMYSWRLMMAPRIVQDYVAAHEACHLVEMNHSARYWAFANDDLNLVADPTFGTSQFFWGEEGHAQILRMLRNKGTGWPAGRQSKRLCAAKGCP